MLGMWISVHTDRSDKNGQVAAVCATHSNLRLSLVHFNLALAEYRSAQLFTLTYQWQPLQYDPHRPPNTHTHTLPHVILSVCQHTHTFVEGQRHFPIHPQKPQSTHASLQSSTLCKRAEQAPACPRDDIFYKNEILFSPGTPVDWQLRATCLLEELLQARRSGTNLSWAVWIRGQSGAEGPGVLRAFTRDLHTSGSLVVTPTKQS